MSVSPLSICSFSGNHTTPPPNISRYRDTSASIVFPQQNTSSMFGSLKKKLTKRGSNPLKSAEMTNASAGAASRGYLAPHNGNSLTSGAPPTRRPSMFALAVRLFSPSDAIQMALVATLSRGRAQMTLRQHTLLARLQHHQADKLSQVRPQMMIPMHSSGTSTLSF